MGLTDLTLGFDTWSAAQTPSVAPALEAYLAIVASLPGAVPIQRKSLRGYHLPPDAAIRSRPRITEILAGLIQQANTPA